MTTFTELQHQLAELQEENYLYYYRADLQDGELVRFFLSQNRVNLASDLEESKPPPGGTSAV